MKKVNFRDWTVEKLEDAFNLEELETSNHPLIDRLCAFEYELSAFENQALMKLQAGYKRRGREDWNEAELINKFISPLIVFSDLDNGKFSYFVERELSTTIGDYELTGKVDGMVATGYRSPKKPYFCINEYKRESEPNSEPRGQLLSAMLTAQSLNQDANPIYGVYVVGKLWRFVVLTGNTYAFSDSFVADKKDIFSIYRILKALKIEIEQIVNG